MIINDLKLKRGLDCGELDGFQELLTGQCLRLFLR